MPVVWRHMGGPLLFAISEPRGGQTMATCQPWAKGTNITNPAQVWAIQHTRIEMNGGTDLGQFWFIWIALGLTVSGVGRIWASTIPVLSGIVQP